MKGETFTIKSENDSEDLQIMTAKMFIVFGHFLMFSEQNKLPVKVTNIRHKFDVSKTNTHPEGRAIDISVKKWSKKAIEDCIDYMNYHAGFLGAISFKTFRPLVIYHHDAGLGDHFHLQVSR